MVGMCKCGWGAGLKYGEGDARTELHAVTISVQLLLPFLLLDRLDVGLVVTADAIANHGKRKALEKVSLLRRQVQKTLRQLVVVALLLGRVVQLGGETEVLVPMFDEVPLELWEFPPSVLLAEDPPERGLHVGADVLLVPVVVLSSVRNRVMARRDRNRRAGCGGREFVVAFHAREGRRRHDSGDILFHGLHGDRPESAPRSRGGVADDRRSDGKIGGN